MRLTSQSGKSTGEAAMTRRQRKNVEIQRNMIISLAKAAATHKMSPAYAPAKSTSTRRAACAVKAREPLKIQDHLNWVLSFRLSQFETFAASGLLHRPLCFDFQQRVVPSFDDSKSSQRDRQRSS
jgi:hypothetical protein